MSVSVEPSPPKQQKWRFRDVAVLAINAIVVLGSLGALVYFYFDVTRISDYPTQPPNPGEVKVYFDEPGVSALMEVRASEDLLGKIDVTISADDSYQPDSVGFKLVFTGLLSRPPELRVMQEPDEYGCWGNTYVVPEENMTAPVGQVGGGALQQCRQCGAAMYAHTKCQIFEGDISRAQPRDTGGITARQSR